MIKVLKLLRALWIGLAGIVLAASPALAEGLSISPILLTVSETGGPTSFRVGSDRDTKTLIQIRIFKWSQENGEDVLSEATDVRYAPEFFELDAGEEKTVRIRIPDTQGQGIWRIVLDELPTADEVDDTFTEDTPGLKMRVRYVVSMFASDVSDGGDLEFALSEGGPDKMLNITNNGLTYARIYGVELAGDDPADSADSPDSPKSPDSSDDADRTIINPELIYILPGSTMSASILKAPENPSHVTYKIGKERLSAPLN